MSWVCFYVCGLGETFMCVGLVNELLEQLLQDHHQSGFFSWEMVMVMEKVFIHFHLLY